MDILHSSSVDGDGFRNVLFVAGCNHHCKGCHNPQSWDIDNGKEMSIDSIFHELTDESIADITFSGGEPFDQAKELSELADMIISINKNIWIYSGYKYEEILNDYDKFRLLTKCDVLVDGEFKEDLKVPNLKFRGSLNQRIIDIQKSLRSDMVVLYE